MAKKDQQAPPAAQQQELFVIEGNLASRDMLRKSGDATNVTRLYRVKLALIKIRPNFNARQKPQWMSQEMWEQVNLIAELADKIYVNNGPVDPILGDFHKDGNFYINDGERRTLALRHLIATDRTHYPNGEPVDEVLVLLNPPGTTDLERKKKMHDANDNLQLTIMQKARYYQSFTLEPYNMTHDQIADMWPRLSRQTVSNYIMAALELPQEIQDAIDSGEVKMTNALADLRKSKKKDPATTPPASGTDEQPIITGALEEKLKKEEKDKEKLRDEFEQQDNSVDFPGSKSGPKEDRSSNTVVLGTDTIYFQQKREAMFKQFVNRFHTLQDSARQLIVPEKPSDEEDELKAADLYLRREKHVLQQLMNEYDITVK
jgi:ParB-like chromosome segregation protein Spo0J